ncbi:hypothetical protein [Subtercola endophyticus]|uniref:hypothetical protein n=1 Tax=Subtercola endophyticus TaxID=2895559 RepID=UPI001E3C9179|nr:hypothetical protein [Subtercola endophyticus]UFS60845.1 hypothetical protein LQ955_08950 [Subtercola endophyticus]
MTLLKIRSSAIGRVPFFGCASSFVGLDCVGAADLAGALVGDGDVVFGGEDHDWCSGVFVSDAEVVQCSRAAECEFAEFVDDVVADSVVDGFGGQNVRQRR